MRYTRVFADEKGETHFEDVEVELELVDFAPPASPLMLSRFNSATRFAFCVFPSGWFGEWHPTPRKQFFFGLSGEYDVKVSDGESRVFGPGSVVLVEDVAGKGHVTRVVGSEGVLTAIVQLED